MPFIPAFTWNLLQFYVCARCKSVSRKTRKGRKEDAKLERQTTIHEQPTIQFSKSAFDPQARRPASDEISSDRFSRKY